MSSNRPRSCPLMAVPIEIRVHILDYLLPLDRNNSRSITLPTRACEIDHDFQSKTIFLGLPALDPHPELAVDTSPSRCALGRYISGIGLVSHQLHAESNKLLHSSTFIIDISEKTFAGQGCDIYKFVYSPTVWEWNPLLPGLDILRVRELKVCLRPSDHCDFCEYMYDCIEAFCKSLNQRIDGGGLKKLTIEITNTESTGASNFSASHFAWLTGLADKYASVLDSFRRYLGNVQECQINLPEWATEDKELMELVEETRSSVWGTTGVEQSIGVIQHEETRLKEAADKETEPYGEEYGAIQVQEEAAGDTQQPPTNEDKNQQSLETWPEWSVFFNKRLFEKREHEEWDDWYKSGDCSCWDCLYTSKGK